MKKIFLTMMILVLALFLIAPKEGNVGFLNDMEDAVVAKLAADITTAKVESFPAKPETYQFLHPTAAILVHYQGGRSSDTKSVNKINQEEIKLIGITLFTRALKGNDGTYEFIDKIKNSLVGLMPPGCGKIYSIDDGFDDYKTGQWTYRMTFGVKTTFIES